MRLLLDTHALYWYVVGDSKLSKAAEKVIQDISNEILISPASYWEIAIKVRLGKWTLVRPFSDFVEIALNQYGFRILPILPNHANKLIELVNLPDHKDPFDRMLVAQSIDESIPLVSSDPKLDAYGINRIW